MSKRLTLAEQLAEIAEPAPVELDPEEGYAGFSAERNTDKRDLDAARAEYVDVGASKLRKKGEAVYDAKYAGKKSSRNDIFDAQSGSEDEDDDEDEDEEMGDFEDLEAGLGESGEDSQAESGEEESGSEEEEEEEEAPAPVPKAKSKKSSKSSSGKERATTTEQDEKAMMSQLKQAASADVEKGRDVKKQLAFSDNILEARIKIQKAVTSANSLPQPDNAPAYFDLVADELAATLADVEALNEELFSLRKELLLKEPTVELPASLGSSRKRKRGPNGTPAEYLSATLSDLASLETALTPFLRTTITKWSDKVLAASGLAISSAKKFKASSASQNAMAQIDHALGQGERARLVKRTRVNRNLGPAAAVVGKVDQRLEGEKAEVDDECFDDGDFYGQMLRDLVESRMLDLDDPTLASLRLASARGKKTKKVVDTRASKGRKIRYHVHEKVQNFMIPIDAGGWHEEQTDELFSSLLGRSFPKVAEEEEREEEAKKAGEVEVGSLRIFG
ncbi:hypothetical protein RQP46_003414 [Phenoliferia psychrophenolica]